MKEVWQVLNVNTIQLNIYIIQINFNKQKKLKFLLIQSKSESPVQTCSNFSSIH